MNSTPAAIPVRLAQYKMTRILIISLLIACFSTSFGQIDSKSTKKFMKIEYFSDGTIYLQNSFTLRANDSDIDLSFYHKHFSIPRKLPKYFINTKYKNETIKFQREENNKIDPKSNWGYTYTYDSLSRVIYFAYSPCLECSDISYQYFVNYDTHNKVESLVDSINSNDKYKIYYDINGIIKQIDGFNTFESPKGIILHKLAERVSLIQ